jgi:hypothetical protein
MDAKGFGHLGFYTLALYYLAFGIFSFGGAPQVHKLGDRKSMVIGCITFTI